jgi:hypothetical protein
MRTALKLGTTAAVAGAMGAFNRELAGRYIARSLGEMTGLGAKAAQLLAMRLGGGEEAPPPLPLENVTRLIRAAAPALAAQLAALDPIGRPASIGQAHAGRLRDGRRVCIKVMRPGIGDAMQEQLELALRMMALGPPRKFELDIDAYRRFLQERLAVEVDYSAEAVAQRRLRVDLAALSNIVVPEVIEAHQTVLAQSFEAGDTLAQAAAWKDERARRAAAELLLAAFFKMALRTGLLHADLHPGNLGFRAGSEAAVVLYDFGSVVAIPESGRKALRGLLCGDEAGDPVTALVAAGFDPDKLARIPNLGGAVERAFRPLRAGLASPVRDWRLQERLRAELGPSAWWLRTAGPPWVLYVLRALHGALHAAERLACPVSLSDVLERALDMRPPPAPRGGATCDLPAARAARKLRVQVLENGIEQVSIEMPAIAVEQLEDLVPEQAVQAILARGYDLGRIKQDALLAGLKPRELFAAAYDSRTLRVWLE